MNLWTKLIVIVLAGSTAGLARADRYVALNGTNDAAGGYTNWPGAATNINQAVIVATNGETVWVTNGIYTNWSTISFSNIILKSVNGPAVTIIDGNYDAITQGCVYINHRRAVVDGFTIRNGYRIGSGGIGGGGVYIYTQGGTVTNCVIVSNTCTNYYGGGIYMYYTGLVANCVIADNRTLSTDANGRGGGIVIAGGTNTMVVNCTIYGNSAGQAGGGVYVSIGGGVVRSCLIASNTAAERGGGVFGYDMILENCTVVTNWTTGAGGGGGINIINTTGTIINTIIYSNKAPVATYNNYMFYNTNTSAGAFSNSCFYPELSGNSTNYSANNITNYPQFMDPVNGDYRLSRGSPCVNAGLNQEWMGNATDMDDHRRIDNFNQIVDIGAYEYIPCGSMFTVK